MTVVEKYLNARNWAMNGDGPPVNPELLTEYVNLVRAAKHLETGPYYEKKLVITGMWLTDTEIAKPLFETAIDHDYEIVAR